jgi:hypothetical protein
MKLEVGKRYKNMKESIVEINQKNLWFDGDMFPYKGVDENGDERFYSEDGRSLIIETRVYDLVSECPTPINPS